jgi:hypothetical protein
MKKMLLLGFLTLAGGLLIYSGCGKGPDTPTQQVAEALSISCTGGGVYPATGIITNNRTCTGAVWSQGLTFTNSMSVTMSVYPSTSTCLSMGQFSVTFVASPVTFTYQFGAQPATIAVANPSYSSISQAF